MGSQHSIGRLWENLRAIGQQRCPRCREGRMFKDRFTMNDPCPVCRLLFEREEGYFLGAMYLSYAFASAFLVAVFFVATALLPGWDSRLLALVAVVAFLPLVPAVFRYSRVLWVHYDRSMCPTNVSAGSYEKRRQRELDAREKAPRSPEARG